MRKIVRRLAAVAAMALIPMAAVAAMPAVGSADPTNCDPGQWWDPTANICRPLGQGPQPLNCDPGQYWDPTTNVCRELGHTAAG
ncbi:MAG TPA: hypothetical protein VNW74_11205 [Mycobacterium sp.]|nr:hypothetical protein [Mycobacterium sp.]HXB86621.1 hypothetical protein [Mycobacterium sp.]